METLLTVWLLPSSSSSFSSPSPPQFKLVDTRFKCESHPLKSAYTDAHRSTVWLLPSSPSPSPSRSSSPSSSCLKSVDGYIDAETGNALVERTISG